MTEKMIDCLIIDDDKGICNILESYCQNLGVFRNIIIANDGVVAGLKLRNQKFGLILLDVNMPRKSGIDVLQGIHASSLNCFENFVIVSGEIDIEKMREITSTGIKHVLVKPFKEENFKERVLPVLNQTCPNK